MEASRDLDARIAEIVGDKLCYHELDAGGHVCKKCHLSKTFWWPKWGKIEPPNHYSRDIASAMIAKDKIMARPDIDDFILHQTGHGYYAGFNTADIEDMTCEFWANEATAPLAICGAILMVAKGIGQ